MTTLLINNRNGLPVSQSCIDLGLVPVIGDLIRYSGIFYRVTKRQTAHIVAPDYGIPVPQWSALLYVESAADGDEWEGWPQNVQAI